MIRRILMALSFAGFILLSFMGWEGYGASRQLVAAADPWPPYFDPRSPRLGVASEVVREALRSQGYSVSFRVMPWDAAQKAVYEGRTDMIIDAWYTQEREKRYLVSVPYIKSRIVFFKRKDSPFQYRGKEDLNGLRVGLIKGYAYGEEFLSWDNYKREYDVSFISLALKVASGKLDLVPEDKLVGMRLIKDNEPWLLEVLEPVEAPLRETTIHVMVSRKLKDGEEILKAFERGLKEMKRSGQYQRILATYGATASGI